MEEVNSVQLEAVAAISETANVANWPLLFFLYMGE
jgi:hypothetical protein